MIPGITASRIIPAAAADGALPSMLSLGDPLAVYAVSQIQRVRAMDVSPDGTKITIAGFTQSRWKTFSLDASGSAAGQPVIADSVISFSKSILSLRCVGDGTIGLVVLNSPWEIVRYKLSAPYVFSVQEFEASASALGGASGGALFPLRSGLAAYMYTTTGDFTRISMPAPGAIEAAFVDYTASLGELLGLDVAAGDAVAGMYMSDGGERAWIAIGAYSTNSRGRLAEVSMATPFDMRTASLVRAISQPSGTYIAGHPIGYSSPQRRLLLSHQASGMIGEYAPAYA